MKTTVSHIINILAGAAIFAGATSGMSLHAAEVPAPSTIVTGIMVRNDDWTSSDKAGAYSIEVTPGGKITSIRNIASMANVAAAVKKDNLIYCIEASPEGFFYSKYSTNNWTISGIREEIDEVNVASDLTFDPVSNRTYGGFWDEDYAGFSRFASFDVTTAEASDIKNANRDERDIFAIAADGKGTIYCLFGAYNYLAKLDPQTGALERVGRTGLNPVAKVAEQRVSSMCYDSENDRLIAAVYEEEGFGASKKTWSALYTINPYTAEVSKVMDLPGNACIAGLYVNDGAVAADAPGEPTGLEVSFSTPLSLQGSVRFNAPSKTAGGASIQGSIMAIVSINGSESVVDGILPGSPVITPAFTFTEGRNDVRVTMANNSSRGGSATVSVWAGEDAPVAATNVVANVAGGKASLSWTAPAAGQHGGALDPSNLRYRIVRQPDGVTVADAATGTSFTDSNLGSDLKSVYYEVTAYNTKGTAPAAVSNSALVAGALTVPFDELFTSADDFALWTVENSNGGATWFYHTGDGVVPDPCATYKYDEDKLPGDDWLISPAIALKAGETYKVTYSWRVYNSRYAESFELKLGTAPASTAMTIALASHENVRNVAYQTAEAGFTVPEDGNYYLGIHNYSDAYQWQLYVDNVGISIIDAGVPAPVADLKVLAGERGAMSASISFTVPSKTAKGNPLEGTVNATILRDGSLVAMRPNLTPGQKVEFTDNAVAKNGKAIYTVSCSNNAGSSVPVTAEIFVGKDVPGPVRNLVISERDGHPYLSWDAPETGANGGWFDPSQITYRIVRGTLPDPVTISEDCTDTYIHDTGYNPPTSTQTAFYYLVTPYAGEDKGTYMRTELMLFGNPYKAPMTETFPDAYMTWEPWAYTSTGGDGGITFDNMGYNPSAPDQNGDRGLVTFHSVGRPMDTSSELYSPKIDISSLSAPEVSFWLYHAPGEGNETMSMLIAPGTDTFSPLEGAKEIRRDAASGWVRYSFSLSSYKSAPWVRIGFRGTACKVADMYLDNFAISEAVATDAAITSLTGPARIALGEKAVYSVKVLNSGSTELHDVTVVLTDASGIRLGASEPAALASGTEETIRISVETSVKGRMTVRAEVSATGDADPANNKAEFTTNVVEPNVAPARDLAAVANEDGSATISWSEPSSRGAVTDDVESYQDWAISGIGEWSMWDGDYDYTVYINKDLGQYPNATERKAFQICNASTLGIDIWDEGKTHSGNKMFMAIECQLYVNNDWLISPELNGGEQWISFYARSFTHQNTAPERMRVWYSTTDNDPANFTEITTGYVQLPATWTEYSYFLPEGTRYFAINCVSEGGFAMFVDDICFNDLSVPTWKVTGYEVWCNGSKIGETSETSFTDSEASTRRKSTYTVRAIYDRGEAPLSEECVLDMSGINGITGSEAVVVSAADGTIYVEGAVDLPVTVCTPAGQTVYSTAAASDLLCIPAHAGIYIVRAGTRTFKIAMK